MYPKTFSPSPHRNGTPMVGSADFKQQAPSSVLPSPARSTTSYPSHDIDILEQSSIEAEHNRTSALLNHISDLRQLLKQQIDKSQALTASQNSIKSSLHQQVMYIDFLSNVNAARSSDDMFDIASTELQKIFNSRSAALYTLDSASHELLTRSQRKTIHPSALVFHATQSEFPYNLNGSDPALSDYNSSCSSKGALGVSAPQPLSNALISRLVDPDDKVVGTVEIANHLSKSQYDADDERILASLLRPLAAVASTIDRNRRMESRISDTENRAAKLEKASDSKWLLSGVVDDVLNKVSAPPSSFLSMQNNSSGGITPR